jgi:hypothetical protein
VSETCQWEEPPTKKKEVNYMKTKHLTVIATMCFGGLLLVSTAAQAQTWSSAASVCQPGTDSAGLYTFSAAAFEFTGTKTGLIRTRCAVTNPLDLGVPGWKTLVVGYQDPDGTGVNYQVNAQLNRVSKSTGTNYILAVFDSSSFAVTTATSRSISFTHTFDFTNFAYYVTLSVTRVDANENPAVWLVELE